MGGLNEVNQARKGPGRRSGLGVGSAGPFRPMQSSLDGDFRGALPGAPRERPEPVISER